MLVRTLFRILDQSEKPKDRGRCRRRTTHEAGAYDVGSWRRKGCKKTSAVGGGVASKVSFNVGLVWGIPKILQTDVIHEQPPCEASRCALMAGNKRTICCRPDDDGRYDRRRRCYFEASMIGAAPPSFVEISLSSQRRPIIRWTSDTAINMSSLHFRGVCQAYIIPNSSERFVQ